MKWRLKVFLKYLTPSSALRDSQLGSPLRISASPTNLFFSAGSRFLASSTVSSNQSSISSSYLNQDVGPSKSGGIFVVIPLPAAHCSDDSARYAPTTVTHHLALLALSNNTHLHRTLYRTRFSSHLQQGTLRYRFVVVNLLCVNRT